MNYNLIVNFYQDKTSERQAELDFSLIENFKNQKFEHFLVIVSEKDYSKLLSICPEDCKKKLIPVVIETRPTYNDYFYFISKTFPDTNNINVLSNLDIIIPEETLIYSTFYLTEPKSCLALTRYDINNGENYKSNSTFFNRADSQDTWIFKGSVENISGANYGLGIAGCDNGIAHLLETVGYVVKNPSITLKTYHLHLTNIRNYTNVVGQAIERIPPPYKLLTPTA